MGSYALTVIGISLLIVLHELGHYLMARACGMRVLRFSLGFGPKLLECRFGETVWQLAALPVGGYVQIQGMGPAETDGTAEDARSYRNRPRWQRALVMFAGPATNWLFAAGCIAVLAGSVGFTRYDRSSATVGQVSEDSPAAEAGLRAGDQVLAVQGEPVQSWDEMAVLIKARAQETITLAVQRGGERLLLEVRPGPDSRRIGIEAVSERLQLDPGRALLAGVVGAWSLTAQYAELLWRLIAGESEGRVAGLPGIVKMISAQASRGLQYLLESLAWLSVGLTLLNLLPVPALDGSRLVFLGIEGVRRRPNNPHVEGIIHGVGLLAMLGFILFVSVRDVIAW